MSNYFEYQDFAKVDRSKLGLSTSSNLQSGSNIEQLRNGIQPYEYASFEKNAYITTIPKTLAKKTDNFGVLTSNVSDENGAIAINIDIMLPSVHSISGITIGCVNKLSEVEITYYGADNIQIRKEIFDREYIVNTLQFFNMASEEVKRIVISILGTEEPYRFVGIYRIDLGSLRIFNDTNLIDAEINSYYSVDGSTIEYDVMRASIFHEDDIEYMFVKRQPIVYKDVKGNILHKFYIDKGEHNTNNTMSLTAYDSVALLEGKFLGGIYGFEDVYTGAEGVPYSFNQLIADIFSGTDVEYNTDGTDNIMVTGYIPICTRRKALSLLCRGTNVRCVKQGGVLVFKPISSGANVNYDDSVIIEEPSIKTSQKVGWLTLKGHNYKKTNETVELFNWYLKQGENTQQIIEFPEPVWKVRAYEVTGVDPNGFDIISETPSTNVVFANSPQGEGDENVCNYAILGRVSTSNKVIIKGWKISDNTDDYVVSRSSFDVNADYDEITISDITIIKTTKNNNGKNISLISEIAQLLFANANQITEQRFEVVEVDKPQVGDNINTSLISSPVSIKSDKGDITYNVKISSVTDDLSGVYKVVAE